MRAIRNAVLFSLAVLCQLSFADAVYPYTTPTYLPNAQAGAATYSAPADYLMTLNGISTVALRVTGTCTSLAASLQASNDGTNWTGINAASVGSASNSYAITAPGFWRADVGGASAVRLHITALTASCTVALTGTQAANRTAVDPCADPAKMKSSAAIAQTSGTTAAIIAASSGKSIYVCGLQATAVGTNPTATLESGTQITTACDTTAANLTGAMNPSATVGSISLGAGGSTVLATPASSQLCLITGPTTSIQGVVTYVQQ